MIFVDTDILIDFLRNKEYAINIINKHKEYLVSTEINFYELLFGAKFQKNIKEERLIKGIFQEIDSYTLNREIIEKAAIIRSELMHKGKEIGQNDCFIAAIVMQNKGALLTRNAKHFERIKGLQVIEV